MINGVRNMDDDAVLVVEDDGDIRSIYVSAFGAAGLDVHEVATQAEAVASEGRPSCVVLDWNLPDGSGLDVAQALHQRWGAALPIVLVTGAALGPQDVAATGAVSWLTKPFDVEEVIQTVRRAMRRRRRRTTKKVSARSRR